MKNTYLIWGGAIVVLLLIARAPRARTRAPVAPSAPLRTERGVEAALVPPTNPDTPDESVEDYFNRTYGAAF